MKFTLSQMQSNSSTNLSMIFTSLGIHVSDPTKDYLWHLQYNKKAYCIHLTVSFLSPGRVERVTNRYYHVTL